MKEIVKIRVSDIKPYWRNPRINDKTVEALEKSIERYGFNVPLVIDKENVIVTGHARYRALRNLGWEHALCVRADHLDDRAVQEYRLLDNRIQEITEWETDELQKEIASIGTFDIAMDFFDGALDSVMGLHKEPIEAIIDINPTGDEGKREFLCPYCGEDISEVVYE